MQRFYIGTYTNQGSEGIYTAEFDAETGAVHNVRAVAKLKHPTFLAVNRNGSRLYAAGDVAVGEGGSQGVVVGYRIDAESGDLTEFTKRVTGRGHACYVALDADGRNVLIADYGGGSISVLPADAEGTLGPACVHISYEYASGVNPDRQKGPHAHSINLHPALDTVYAPDLGADRIYQYRLDRDAHTLEALAQASVSTAPGAGPRHLAFHPDGLQVAVIHELNGSLTSYRIDTESGALVEVQTVATLPDGFAGDNSCADIHFSADGRFLYGSNRGHDSIVVYAYDAGSARMTLIQREPSGGGHPRNFAISPDGTYVLVANRDSDNIVVFRRDAETGMISETGECASVSMPVCIAWL